MSRWKMGQSVGRIPKSWGPLNEERRRLLDCCHDIKTKLETMLDEEVHILLDNSNPVILSKLDGWLGDLRAKEPDYLLIPQQQLDGLRRKLSKRMEIGYLTAREDLDRLYNSMDELEFKQWILSVKLMELKKLLYKNERLATFRSRLAGIRVKIFKHLRESEKIFFRYKRVKAEFAKKVHRVDLKFKQVCNKQVQRLIEKNRKKLKRCACPLE